MTARRRPRCAVCRGGRGVRVFYDRDMVRVRCPDCRPNDPVRTCPLCVMDLSVHDVCPEGWGWVVR
jgi:hypothetical protein